jgi:hypothetical protein
MAAMAESPAAASTQPRGQRLWAVLLVLDSFFVITFGGTLAMKAYQHWQAPVDVQPPRRGHKPPKAPAPKPADAPAAEPAKPAEAPKAPEAAKPAKQAETPAEAGLRPPKPSMIHEAPTREKAVPQTASKAAAAAAPAAAPAAGADAAKQKAVPTDFSIKSPGAKTVELAGAFIVRGGKKAMVGHPDGTWTVTLYLTPNTYRYWFLVNGKKTLDPAATAVDRGASVRTVAP